MITAAVSIPLAITARLVPKRRTTGVMAKIDSTMPIGCIAEL